MVAFVSLIAMATEIAGLTTPVAVQHGGAEPCHKHRAQHASAAADKPRKQRWQPALAVVVRLHQHRHI